MKLSKTQLSKIKQSGRFFGRLLEPLMKLGFSLMENVLSPFTKSVLISLGLTAGTSGADVEIHKKVFQRFCHIDK